MVFEQPVVDRYQVDLAADSLFTFKVSDWTVTDTVKMFRSLIDQQRYFWRVRAHNPSGWGPYSGVLSFTADRNLVYQPARTADNDQPEPELPEPVQSVYPDRIRIAERGPCHSRSVQPPWRTGCHPGRRIHERRISYCPVRAFLLDRIQFAFTISFHYLFPQLTMGLALLLVVLKGIAIWKKNEQYNRAATFWAKIFAVNFFIGVVTGIPMEFQFGTNWARFSTFAGGVIGQTLAMEGVFAFFLESSFLGLFLFGKRSSDKRSTSSPDSLSFWVHGSPATSSWPRTPGCRAPLPIRRPPTVQCISPASGDSC